MARVMIVSLIFFCGALTAPAYAQDNPFENCSFANVSQDKNYELTVDPTSYKANSSYSVMINGSINNTTILFQVVISTNSFVENGWKDGNSSCNGVYFQTTADQTSLTTNWTSPSNTSLTSVTIKAHVKTADNTISMVSFDLTNVYSTMFPITTTTITNTTTTITNTSNATTGSPITAASKIITTTAINTTTDATNNSTSNSTNTTITTARNVNNITTTVSGTTNAATTLLSSCALLRIIQVMTLAFLCHLTS
uniref:Y' element ATP-dependent helicase YJL225C-like n=1 Tax=Geotrypetes seraphini TaxID=260995 RepID=A0A6P8NR10_GEOSA|nr:Y' element ATP-dependent helicase YJL225C-like [Geotrypetes seraphini]